MPALLARGGAGPGREHGGAGALSGAGGAARGPSPAPAAPPRLTSAHPCMPAVPGALWSGARGRPPWPRQEREAPRAPRRSGGRRKVGAGPAGRGRWVPRLPLPSRALLRAGGTAGAVRGVCLPVCLCLPVRVCARPPARRGDVARAVLLRGWSPRGTAACPSAPPGPRPCPGPLGFVSHPAGRSRLAAPARWSSVRVPGAPTRKQPRHGAGIDLWRGSGPQPCPGRVTWGR